MKKSNESEALREVLEWKEQAYREVADLDIEFAIKKRLEDSRRSSEQLRKMLKKPPHHV